MHGALVKESGRSHHGVHICMPNGVLTARRCLRIKIYVVNMKVINGIRVFTSLRHGKCCVRALIGSYRCGWYHSIRGITRKCHRPGKRKRAATVYSAGINIVYCQRMAAGSVWIIRVTDEAGVHLLHKNSVCLHHRCARGSRTHRYGKALYPRSIKFSYSIQCKTNVRYYGGIG